MGRAVQMNVRIDDELKREGDAVLSQVGLTPSQAVRSLWRVVLGNRGNPRAIAEMLDPRRADDDLEKREERLAAIERGRHICDDFLRTHGINPHAVDGDLPADDELLEEAYIERWAERGLL